MDARDLIRRASKLKAELGRLEVEVREYVDSLQEGQERDDVVLAMAFLRGAESLVDRASSLLRADDAD